MVVDHGSRDATLPIARQYGARVLRWEEGVAPGYYLQAAEHEWIFCLDPRESLTEALEATLLEWVWGEESESTAQQQASTNGFSVRLREQATEGWIELPDPQTRLVSRSWNRWQGWLPANESLSTVLQGELLRFVLP
jgi:hypothetical protein